MGSIQTDIFSLFKIDSVGLKLYEEHIEGQYEIVFFENFYKLTETPIVNFLRSSYCTVLCALRISQ